MKGLKPYSLGKLYGIEVIIYLEPSEIREKVNLDDLSLSVKRKIERLRKERKKSSIETWCTSNQFILDAKEYKRLLKLNSSVLKNRSVNDKIYFKYLLQSKKVNEIKSIIREYNGDNKENKIYNYSQLKKQDLIELLVSTFTSEEIFEYIEENEQEIISSGIAKALKIIHGKSNERIIYPIRIVNSEKHEVEISFKKVIGRQAFDLTCFLSITEESISDPERDCDCLPGANLGFCPHFWVAFMYSLKNLFFKLYEWNLTFIPNNINSMIEKINFREKRW